MIKYIERLLSRLPYMGIKFGEIDSVQIIDNEFRAGFVSRLVEWMFNNNPQLRRPSPEEIDEIKKKVIRDLKNKYPKSGIKLVDE